MEIKRIFTDEIEGRLFAVCYPEDKRGKKWVDVFKKITEMFSDPVYLFEFFKTHADELANDFWGGMSIEDAIEKVRNEIHHLDNELYSIENKLPGYEDYHLSNIFLPLHESIYSLKFDKEQFRKAKPNFSPPMVRIYGFELQDGTLIVTGGTIKLTKGMVGKRFDDEINKINRLKNYLDAENIVDKEGLIE